MERFACCAGTAMRVRWLEKGGVRGEKYLFKGGGERGYPDAGTAVCLLCDVCAADGVGAR
jgi:hypothetical protein